MFGKTYHVRLRLAMVSLGCALGAVRLALHVGRKRALRCHCVRICKVCKLIVRIARAVGGILMLLTEGGVVRMMSAMWRCVV